jgi:hypothetical protein
LKENKFFKRIGHFFVINKKMLLIWTLIATLVGLGIYLHVDKGILTVFVLVLGIIGNAFAGLAAVVSMVPIIGPLLIKVFSLPIFWLFNSTGMFVSAIAIKRGYKKEVLNFKIMTTIFLIGFAIGFIIAKLV